MIDDRRLLARALGKAALANTRNQRRVATAPAFLHGGVPERMAALLDGPTPPARSLALLAAGCVATVAVMVFAAVHASTDCLALLSR